MTRHLPVDGSELVAALGLVFVVSGVGFWSQTVLGTVTTLHVVLYELVIHVLFGAVMLGLGIHIERSALIPEERREVIVWSSTGFLLLVGLAIWSQLGPLLAGRLTETFVSNVVVFGSMGGAFGAFIGVNRGRVRRNELLAERTEAQRETLELLTRLLRHDIRNDLQVIVGHADFLEEAITEDGEDSLAAIQSRTDTILRLLEDSATLVETLGADRDLEPIALDRVIQDEVAGLRDSYPEVTVETDIPDDVRVIGDQLIHQLFSNLLTNAAAHNDPEDLTVRVDASPRDGVVDVAVSDDGTGVPADLREEVFGLGEKGPESSGDGLGLYLVSRLAEVYGGSVRLDESAAGGAEFTVTLPRSVATSG